MRFNLLPWEEQKRRQPTSYLLIRQIVMVISLFGVVLLVPLCSFFWWQAWHEQENVMAMAQPLGEDIRRHNQQEQTVRHVVKSLQERQRQSIYWAPLLVSLAETKPEVIEIDRIQGDGQTVTITGRTTDLAQARQWQQRLQKQPGIRAVKVQTMKHEQGVSKILTWEVQVGDDKRQGPAGTAPSL